jgi:hypothetical protein
MMLVLLKNLIVVKFFIAKMSDLEAPTTNSGGRKARPYDGQVNPFGRGGVYPRPQRARNRSTRVAAVKGTWVFSQNTYKQKL